MMQPTQSWVARRLHLGASSRDVSIPLHDLKPGVYAVKIPNEDEAEGDVEEYEEEEGDDVVDPHDDSAL